MPIFARLSVKMMNDLLGVVLCGGQGRRMGGADKGLVIFQQRPMVTYGLAALKDCQQIIINANRHQTVYRQQFGVPVISDDDAGYAGPLAGMLAALRYAQSQGLSWVVTVPCDAPYITADYVTTLYQAKSPSDKILFADDGAYQPVFALLHVSILGELEQFLRGKEKRILAFYRQIGFSTVEFSQSSWFTNINTESDKLLASQ